MRLVEQRLLLDAVLFWLLRGLAQARIYLQSAAFVVVSIPGKTNPFEREARGGARSLSGELHHRKDSVVKASKEDPHIEDNLE